MLTKGGALGCRFQADGHELLRPGRCVLQHAIPGAGAGGGPLFEPS